MDVLFSLVVWLVMLVIFVWFLRVLLGALTPPGGPAVRGFTTDPVSLVVYLIVLLIAVAVLFRMVGVIGPRPVVWW